MIIFDFLKDIVYRKKGNLLENPENEQEFDPYMLQRWLSMHSPNMAKLLNATTNRLYSVYDTKQEWYKIYLATIPKTYSKRIKYIKKVKKEKGKKEEEDIISFIAKSKQMSKREVKLYIEEFEIDLKNVKKAFDIK